MIHRGKLGAKWKRQRDNLRERIEEAEEEAKVGIFEGFNCGFLENIVEILSDSDEGDDT